MMASSFHPRVNSEPLPENVFSFEGSSVSIHHYLPASGLDVIMATGFNLRIPLGENLDA